MSEILSLDEYAKKFEISMNLFLTDKFKNLSQVWYNRLGKTENKFLTDKLIAYTFEFISGGKKFRPYLVYLQSQPMNYEESINYAIAIELLHSFALVHDDFMDKAITRRNKSTINKYFLDCLAEIELSPKIDKEHLANSMAVLIGDYLFTLAEEAFENYSNNVSIENHRSARSYFQLLKSEVILGQLLDIELNLAANPDKTEILQKTFLKTANYSVTRPLQIGTAIRSGSATEIDFCQEFGLNLGLAFQIQDDYIDLTGSETVTGKRQFGDIYEGKHTLASWYLKNSTSNQVKAEFDRYFGSEQINTEALWELVQSSGVSQFLKDTFLMYYKKSYELTDNQNLVSLVKYLENRQK